MPVQTFHARTSEHTLLKGKYQWVTFELLEPRHIDFQAGQFIMLNIPGMQGKRSYSIASSPIVKHQLDILVDVGPQGDGSLYLQSLNPGEEVTFMGPAGQFTLADDPAEQKLVMIATGSGISAIRSMILDLLQARNDQRQIHLHWGMRHADDIFWEEDFHLLEEEFPNFHFDLVLSKAPGNWPLCSGHVTDCLKNHYDDYQNTGFYMCGNQKMIQDVSGFLAQNGVDDSHIHHEQFY
jgi:phenol hydroxylase P5 protein